MSEFKNVKIIGLDSDGTIPARSVTGTQTSGINYDILNILNVDQLYIHSASGNFPASTTASTASAGTAGTTLFTGATNSGFAGFLKIKLSDGTFRSIPMYNSVGY